MVVKVTKLRQIRIDRGLSQADLAKLLGVTSTSVSRYETEDHRITLPLLRDLARALNCSPAAIISDEELTAPVTVVAPLAGGSALTIDRLLAESLGTVSGLRVMTVEDDAMSPTLAVGDTCIVDTSATRVTRDGLFAIDAGGAVVIKRIGLNPIRKMLTVSSDNSLYGEIGVVSPTEVTVLGRVVWIGRRV